MLGRTERLISPKDAALLDRVQRAGIRYFWEYAHPISGLARFRSNVTERYSAEHTASGGSGFGIMAIIVGVHRGWIRRKQAVEHLLKMTDFLLHKAPEFHGAVSHIIHGTTGAVIPFAPSGGLDDGGDIVETSFLCMGLICARQYFNATNVEETQLRSACDTLWKRVEWRWYTRDGCNALYWHWSPTHQWAMNHDIRGWNECLVTYVLAAASPTHPINPAVYRNGWPQGFTFLNQREYYGISLQLGPDYGGPLFFAHYSFTGLDPRGLYDFHGGFAFDYWKQNVHHTLINREHCLRNPHGFAGFGEHCWGLTATDDQAELTGFDPLGDCGVIRPTAALSSLPYTPEESMQVLRYLSSCEFRERLWGEFGFFDGFSLQTEQFAEFVYAIQQGPLVAMIENYRSGLLWQLFMSAREVRRGLQAISFQSPYL